MAPFCVFKDSSLVPSNLSPFFHCHVCFLDSYQHLYNDSGPIIRKMSPTQDLFLGRGSEYVVEADLELPYVAQTGLDLMVILLPQPDCAGITDMYYQA